MNQVSEPLEVGVKVKYLRELGDEFKLSPATSGSAGVDLRAAFEPDEIVLGPGERYCVPTGLAIEIERPGLAGFVFSRSGLGAKDGLTVAQGVGVIDPDYRGEIMIWLLNTSGQSRVIKRAERVAQLILLPYFAASFRQVEELGDTARGAGGFGHTGKH